MKRYLVLLILMTFGNLVSAQSLEDYWQMAAENNPSLTAKFTAYLAALEKVDQQKALPDPTLSFGYFISPVETRVGAQRFKLSVNQMFPWMGTLAKKESWAIKAAETKYAEFEDARNNLFLKISEAYLALSELKQEIDIKERNLVLLRSYEPIAKTKYESNLTSLADLLRIQIRIEQGATELELLQLKTKPLTSDLNTYLNRPVDTEIAINSSLSMNEEGLNLDSALVTNSKHQINQLQIEGAQTQIELSDLRRKPNIGIGLDYAFVSERTDMNLEDNGKDILMPMVSISLPIFGKKNQAFKKEAQLAKESLELESESIQNQIRNDWLNSDYLEKSALKELDLYTREIRNTQSLLNVLTSEYSNNSSNFEELLQTQQRLLQLQVAQVKAKNQLQRATLRKRYLSGYFLNQNP